MNSDRIEQESADGVAQYFVSHLSCNVSMTLRSSFSAQVEKLVWLWEGACCEVAGSGFVRISGSDFYRERELANKVPPGVEIAYVVDITGTRLKWGRRLYLYIDVGGRQPSADWA